MIEVLGSTASWLLPMWLLIQASSIRSEKVCRGSKGARVQCKTFTHNISMSFLCKARISFVLFVLSLFVWWKRLRWGWGELQEVRYLLSNSERHQSWEKHKVSLRIRAAVTSKCLNSFIKHLKCPSVIHTHCKRLWLLPFRSQRSTTPRWYWGLWWTIWPVR